MRVDGVWQPAGEENVPPLPNPEQPPLAPHDPPDPAPQAAAWARALRVISIASQDPIGVLRPAVRTRGARTNKRGRAAIKGRRPPLGPTH